MSEHLTADQIERYHSRSMSAAELLVAMDHLALCDTCRELFNPAHKIRATGDGVRTDLRTQALDSNHLSFEDSAAYVDEHLSELDREIVESHLDLCSRCTTEIIDLRAFRAEMTTYPEIERVPSKASKRKLLGSWRPAFSRFSFQLATAASIVLLCGLIAIVVLLRKEPAGQPTQLSELQKPADPDSAQTPPAPVVEPSTQDNQNPDSDGLLAKADEIRDGSGIVTLDKQGNITGLENLPLPYQQAVKTGITSKRPYLPSDLNGLAGKAGVLLGGDSHAPSFDLVGPIGTVVKTDLPTFRWRALDGATSYVVTVYDANFNKVASSDPQPGTEWTTRQKLQRGDQYSWQVTAISDDKEILSPAPPAPDAKFKVLEAARTKELDQAKQAYSSSHLVLGVLYQRAGLLDDAEREFKTLYRANPKSPTVRKLLRDVKSLRQPK